MKKKTLFITTKNLDYLRNVQEIELLKQDCDVHVIGAYDKSYPMRLIKVYLKLLFTSMKRIDDVFVGFAPQLILPLWKWKFREKKITIDFFISLYDTMVFDRKKIKRSSVIAKILKKIDEITIRYSDHIIADTKEHGKYFTEEFFASPEKIEVLYLQADTEFYYPRKTEKPEKYRDSFVVLYFGSVLPLQGIDILLDAIRLLKDEKNIVFEVIGPINEKYQKVESENVVYFQWLPQKQLAEHIAYADLCLAGHFNNNIMKAKRTIPGKAYIYHAMNKDMVLGDNPANHELYCEGDEGIYYVPMGDSKALAKKILEISENTTRK